MFGGVGKSAGWATILGAVGVVLGASVSANAADLEERVAELEATTAREGNRKVSSRFRAGSTRPSCGGTTAASRTST